jgi:hypothetical protein
MVPTKPLRHRRRNIAWKAQFVVIGEKAELRSNSVHRLSLSTKTWVENLGASKKCITADEFTSSNTVYFKRAVLDRIKSSHDIVLVLQKVVLSHVSLIHSILFFVVAFSLSEALVGVVVRCSTSLFCEHGMRQNE